MAIAIDATSNGTGATATSITWSHTCTGDDRILIVACGIPDSDTITGVTYNSVALTLIDKIQVDFTGVPDRYIYLWYLIAPATGANDIVVSSSASQILKGAAASYTGVKQTGQPDSSAKNKGASTNTFTATTTTVANNSWLVMVGKFQDTTISAGTDTTLRRNWNAPGDGALFDSNATKSPGSNSLIANLSTNAEWGYVIASISPVAVATTNVNSRSLLGVGR